MYSMYINPIIGGFLLGFAAAIILLVLIGMWDEKKRKGGDTN